LEPFKVGVRPGIAEVELLRDTIERAEDERPVQSRIQEHPSLIGALFTHSLGVYVRPQVSLGGDRIPDFAVAVADSTGINWTLVELESPTASAGMADGELAAKARQAVRQIKDWREWLMANLDYARRAPSDQGAGLSDIRPESPGLVIMGRRWGGRDASALVRRRLREESQITIHSYDWLLEAIDPRTRPNPRLGTQIHDSDVYEVEP
jgi:hypothetical protein